MPEEAPRSLPSAAADADAFNRALALLQAGDAPAAECLFVDLLQRQPRHAGALHLLGIVRAQQGELDTAIALFQQALALRPQDAIAHHNLGNALALQNRRAEALASLDRSLELQPANADALITRAKMQMELQQPIDALRSLDQALALRPNAPEALMYRGDVLAQLSELGMSRREDALQAYRESLAHGGDAEGLHYFMAAMGEGAPPPVAPRRFVVQLFDHYAANFDQHLVQTLQYRTPELIGAALQRVGMAGDSEVLELGCGTGLCAPGLRLLARRLVGVDLSENMLAQARARGGYDSLHCADIEEHLQTLQADFDLIVAADVFVYIGDLQGVFAGAQRALRPGGRFVFSLESHGGADFVLQPSRRYAHAVGYIERLAVQHGFAMELQEPCVLRLNAGAEVPGCVLVLRRI